MHASGFAPNSTCPHVGTRFATRDKMRVGVTEYWIVDPELDAIRVFRRSGETFDRAIELIAEAGDVLTSPLPPGLDVALQRTFGPG